MLFSSYTSFIYDIVHADMRHFCKQFRLSNVNVKIEMQIYFAVYEMLDTILWIGFVY